MPPQAPQHFNEQVHSALTGLLRADGLTPAAAKAKADNHLTAAVARARALVSENPPNPGELMSQWRRACADLRVWIRIQA
jgi:hypothetical protein